MQKRSSKDVNQLAASIVAQATDHPHSVATNVIALQAGDQWIYSQTSDGKNQAAVALGRLGGLKGGKARAKALSAAKKKQIAKRAALARWSRKQTTP